MSDEKQHQDPYELQKLRVAQQAGVIDAASRVSEMTKGFFGSYLNAFAKTDFDGHALNAMIDMVDTAKPEHLEEAGKALWAAQVAIQEAAEELKGHINRVAWEGESGEAFRTWGGNLVTNALSLSTFAEVAGNQITAAATGLASVRKAMPPRDNRPDPKTVDDIPTPKRVEGNEEYAAAVQVEKDRQEAINQMNRLASFYAVSQETLAKAEPPTFEAMPDVGVPKPSPNRGEYTPGEESGGGSLGQAGAVGTSGPHATEASTSRFHTGDAGTPLKQVDDSVVYPDKSVGTEINTVGTAPPPETVRPATSLPPSAPGPGGGNGGQVPPFAPGTVPPTFNGPAGRAPGLGGGSGPRAPISAQGRAGNPNGTAAGRGTTGPMGRAAGTGQSGIRGGSTATGASPIGRGVSGGTPRPLGGTTSGRAGGGGSTGAARGNGIIGGRPATSAISGSTGARVPRGTVVGAGGNPSSRAPAGKIGQRGVIGAQPPGTDSRPGPSGRPGRPVTGNADGVVGTPTGRASAARSGGNTAQRPTSARRNNNREEREGQRQPETERRNTQPSTD
ncbi:WXG100 family type VII secretion target [Streptomyces griseus]|uniref:WXG100 family type VII secretion target n=1 Tax=Streptomyces griseus TaxID=1911 RepID=UPI00131DF5FC|nr:hypothetical protein [Streptomyces griseus]